ncbi:uncharacterized protein LOC127751505 [Frankliniella occidentalis]|uniref:Uncharacterized protein LOC113214365 n=1 Tax=Frankliniella occidentalis TaxID=133901 RepID=A0A9C6XUA3_FRAOC|nr:uncharacterized protein LOC113214365 [Frankliniella occidentalis]XP_052131112.1 uncharacterized protein LOC113214365 [Frankliniella occidentalis]XP_052131113.1 uncharacterized protein LOC127751505 [Frankliniella occidentalis]
MYAFIMMLQERSFESYRLRAPLETGFPVTVGGKVGVVLGTGLTRAEAKAAGTEYYNRVCKWHNESCTDWNFNTQDVGGSEPNSPSDKEERGKRKAEDSQEDSPNKRSKRGTD